MRWLEWLVAELAQTCRDALGSWQRTGQLCGLILAPLPGTRARALGETRVTPP
jgi:hypothetical protein